MTEMIELARLDFSSVFLSVFVILAGIKTSFSMLEWLVEKLGLETKWMRKKKEDHTLLIQTAQNLSALQDKYKKDMEQLYESGKSRDRQMHSLTIANRELLAGKINDKYKYYISIGGIPEDEVDEFTSLHNAYNGCGGNHHGDAKYHYIMEHLPVIPVEVTLSYKA